MRRFVTDYEVSKQSSASEIQDICSGFLITEEDSMYTTPTPPGSDAFLYTQILYDEGCTCNFFFFFFHNKSDPQNICRCSYGVLIKKTAYIYKLHDSCRAKRISVDTKSLAQKLHVYIFHTESDAIIYTSAISRLAARVGPHCVRVQVNWVRRQKVCP